MRVHLWHHRSAVRHLLGPHPIELLIWGELPGVVPGHPWEWMKKDALPAWRLVVCVALQLVWSVHGVVIPSLAGAGSAFAFAASDDASQTVLNAIAPGAYGCHCATAHGSLRLTTLHVRKPSPCEIGLCGIGARCAGTPFKPS